MDTRTKAGGAAKKRKVVLWSFFDKGNKQHRYILSLCIQYGWRKPHPVKDMDVADLLALHKWMKSTRCPVQKPLLDMTKKELDKVTFALEKMQG